jgi:hypothetical protein
LNRDNLKDILLSVYGNKDAVDDELVEVRHLWSVQQPAGLRLFLQEFVTEPVEKIDDLPLHSIIHLYWHRPKAHMSLIKKKTADNTEA